MKRISVRFQDDSYEEIQELSSRMNAPIAGLVRYALAKTFDEEIDEIFCIKSIVPLKDLDRSLITPWQEYQRRHDERQALVDDFVARLMGRTDDEQINGDNE